MALFNSIKHSLENLKNDKPIAERYKVVFNALFDSIIKEKLVLKKLKIMPTSVTFGIKALYLFRDLKLDDEATKYLRLILPQKQEESIALIKDISLFLTEKYPQVDITFEFIFDYFEQKAIEQRKIRIDQIFDLWENNTPKSKIRKDSTKAKSDNKKNKTTKTAKESTKKSTNTFKNPYARFISIPFGGMNKKY